MKRGAGKISRREREGERERENNLEPVVYREESWGKKKKNSGIDK